MLKRKATRESKYDVLLIAYKDLDIEDEKKVLHDCISIIRRAGDIRDGAIGNSKGIGCMDTRVGIYHSWFKEEMKEYLDKGYELGIVEGRFKEGHNIWGDEDATKALGIKKGEVKVVVHEKM